MRTALTTWLAAACAVAGFGCTAPDKTQVLTGRVSTRDAVAVRAIDGTTIVTAGRVRSDGTFTLSLPKGHRYRLEVLTRSGVHNIIGTTSGTDLSFKVCEPSDPFDMGGFGDMDCDPMTDPNCKPEPPQCDPGDPNCLPPMPWPCDPTTDPMCKCGPNGEGCGDGGGTGGCDSTDPNCVPPPCDPAMDPNCMPLPCDPATDPTCKCYPGDPNCPPPCDPMTDPNCGVTCDPEVDAMCPPPPPPCTDPTDPTTCKDPCMVDPVACGCLADGTTNDGMSCWPPPEPCDGTNCPDDPWWPNNPPGDFGCGDDGNGTTGTDGNGTIGPDGTVMSGEDVKH